MSAPTLHFSIWYKNRAGGLCDVFYMSSVFPCCRLSGSALCFLENILCKYRNLCVWSYHVVCGWTYFLKISCPMQCFGNGNTVVLNLRADDTSGQCSVMTCKSIQNPSASTKFCLADPWALHVPLVMVAWRSGWDMSSQYFWRAPASTDSHHYNYSNT